jgi:hypothetical protein
MKQSKVKAYMNQKKKKKKKKKVKAYIIRLIDLLFNEEKKKTKKRYLMSLITLYMKTKMALDFLFSINQSKDF